MPIRALVVDDEPLARQGIRARLSQATDVEIVGECESGREAIAEIRRLTPDLVFLDVQMPGLDGFGVVRGVGASQMPPVIFVTAHERHAVRAFEVAALDYLLKPIDDDRFSEAVERARRQIADRRDGTLARRLASVLAECAAPLPDDRRATPARTDRWSVKAGARVVFVDTDDIDWVGAEGDYVRLHARDKSYLLRATMSGMEARLDSGAFVRIHRSAIVRTERIREMRRLPNGEYLLRLADGSQLRASRTHGERVRELIDRRR